MKAGRRWTLAGRTTRWFGGILTATVLLVSIPSAWYLWRSVERELDALVHEELDELAVQFPHTAQDAAAFRTVTEAFNAQHPSNRFAWRLWTEDGTRVLALSGATALLPARDTAPEVREHPERLGRELRWQAERLSSGNVAELVIDGSPQLDLLRRYGRMALLLVLAAALASVAVASMIGRRASRLLLQIADRIRDVRSPFDGVRLRTEELPDEIRSVADALGEMLTNIRAETDRARLMAAAMAHELRSPVQNLLGETEVALMIDGTPSEYRAVLESHLVELRDLGDAIDNLVTLCSAPENLGLAEWESFDLAAEAKLRLARESSDAGRRGVGFELDARGDTTMVGDREALLRALRNLVANGIEWTAAGGTVRTEFRGSTEELVVTVDDDGPGIPEQLRSQVFDPFFRGPTAKNRRAGYGLGLAIVRDAVDRHGGSVDIERSPSGGARIRLTLPRDGGGIVPRKPRTARPTRQGE